MRNVRFSAGKTRAWSATERRDTAGGSIFVIFLEKRESGNSCKLTPAKVIKCRLEPKQNRAAP